MKIIRRVSIYLRIFAAKTDKFICIAFLRNVLSRY
jgi:hypothetical protein